MGYVNEGVLFGVSVADFAGGVGRAVVCNNDFVDLGGILINEAVECLSNIFLTVIRWKYYAEFRARIGLAACGLIVLISSAIVNNPFMLSVFMKFNTK